MRSTSRRPLLASALRGALATGEPTVLRARTSARHLRVALTATSPEPWSVADLRVHR